MGIAKTVAARGLRSYQISVGYGRVLRAPEQRLQACISLEQQLARREHRGLALDSEKEHDRAVYTKLAGVGLDELVDQRRDVLSELGRV